MGNFLAYELFPIICNMSLTASVVIVAVLLARLALRRAPKVFSYALWAVVLFRLLCPVSISSAVSLLGALDAPVKERSNVTSVVEYVPSAIVRQPVTEGTRPVGGVSECTDTPQLSDGKQTAADQMETLVGLMTLTWAAGIAVLLAYSLASLLRLKRRLVGAVRLRENIYLADHIPSPFVMGLFRPKIYLPSSLTETERRYILRHEQYHIRRGDHIVKFLAFLALCVHWFNPLVWAAFLLSGKDMEMSCDEAVVKELGEDIRADYSASLLSFATGHRILAGMPLSFGEGDTGSRIRNLLRWKRPRPWLVAVSAVVCVGLIAACAANPKSGEDADTSDDPSVSTGSQSGQWANMEDYVQSVMLSETEVTYWTYNATRDNTENQVTSPVTGRKLEYLEQGGELAGLAPEGTLEEWHFNYLVKFDADPETVALAGGQSYDDEGYFDLSGSHEVVALRYPDGSYDVLYDECQWEHFDFYNYCETIQEALHDWYVKEYDLDRPLYVVDWADQIEYNDGREHGNYPLHRFDGDGFSIYVPVSAWVMQEPSENHWEWYSAYDSGSMIVVDSFTQSVEVGYGDAQKQGFTPLDDTKQVWTRRQGGINERYWFYPAADGNGSWRVWTLWTDEGVSDYPYIFIEPQTMYLMAENFLVTTTPEGEAQNPTETTGTVDDARYAFGKALWDAYLRGVLPDGTVLDWTSPEGAAQNDFALYDVDGDGQEELLLYWGNASMAGMRLDVFGYQDGAVHTELTAFPMTTFYSNGTATVNWSHNQGLAGNTDFWPYSLYSYDVKTDSYVSVGSVDAWSSEQPAASDEFPTDIDADGDGMVYFLLPADWDGSYSSSYLADGPDYEAWRASYLDGAEPLDIASHTQKLTEDQIAALGYPKPDLKISEPVG